MRRSETQRLRDSAGGAPKQVDRVLTMMLNLYKKRKSDGLCMRCGKAGHILKKCLAKKPAREDAVLQMRELWPVVCVCPLSMRTMT